MKNMRGITLIEVGVIVVILFILLFIALGFFNAAISSNYSVGINDTIETRCISGYQYTIGSDGRPMQILSETGKGVRCNSTTKE